MRKREARWFGVRSLCLFGKKKDGKNIIEERVLVFSGCDEKEAFSKALAELDEYTKCLKTVGYPEVVGYEQDGDELIDGYEVWSELYETAEDLDAFFQSRYGKFKYQPDD
jgi:hypothetical protein